MQATFTSPSNAETVVKTCHVIVYYSENSGHVFMETFKRVGAFNARFTELKFDKDAHIVIARKHR